ncbi:MAG: hypothetical protein JRF35_04760 [Deltaproteobacteria bacterium]|nr:hypothetical protein [Deltaproteobacteria bacterium]
MLIALLSPFHWAAPANCDDYQQVSGLIDLRTSFSDGAHDLKFIVELAREKGFGALVINDHDRMAMEYGLPPFRNIIKKRIERNSINKKGAEEYLRSIKEIDRAYPDMIIIAGSETAPFYYWSGSFFKKNLTAHDHERRILTIGLEKAGDYQGLPILHNGLSTRFVGTFMPAIFFFCIPLFLGLALLRLKGFYRIAGIAIAILSIFLIVNVNPFRSSPFDQYHGDQGIAPYQLLIDYVRARGGMTFWNYPETKSGIRKIGPIFLHTAPYSEVLLKSTGYTGFAALYGDEITVTEPGNIWDEVLKEYCTGKRALPAWGIATADFHREGESGEFLGNFPTVFLVKTKTKEEILQALRSGKMYACRGKHPHMTRLEEFSVTSSNREVKGISGDEITVKGFPRIRISLSSTIRTDNRVRVRLIRSGRVIERYEGQLPIEIEYEDKDIKKGDKEYYRMDLHGYGTIVSNPIFVTYRR